MLLVWCARLIHLARQALNYYVALGIIMENKFKYKKKSLFKLVTHRHYV